MRTILAFMIVIELSAAGLCKTRAQDRNVCDLVHVVTMKDVSSVKGKTLRVVGTIYSSDLGLFLRPVGASCSAPGQVSVAIASGSPSQKMREFLSTLGERMKPA